MSFGCHFQLLMKTIFQFRKMAGKNSLATEEDNFCVGWASFPADPDQQECKRVRITNQIKSLI